MLRGVGVEVSLSLLGELQGILVLVFGAHVVDLCDEIGFVGVW